MERNNKGRKKIEMVKMRNKANLEVTFSKRRSGLFKKASELCTLTGAEVGIIVFSPAGKVYSFGHPSVEAILDRFSGMHINNTGIVQTNTDSHLQNLNENLTQVLAAKEAEEEKKRNYKLVENERKKNPENWWRNSPENLNLSQSLEMKQAVEDLKKKVDDVYSQSHQTPFPHQNYHHHVGSSSSRNAAPGTGTVNAANLYYTNQNRMMDTSAFSYGPNLITPNYSLPFGYNHNNNNIADGAPWYNPSNIQNQEGHPRYN